MLLLHLRAPAALTRFRLGLVAFTLLLPLTTSAAQPPIRDRGGPSAEDARSLRRELVRLDERLALGSFPDTSGRWLGRLAASLERLQEAESPPPAADLLRRLAVELRGVGVEHRLEPEAPPDDTGPDAAAPDLGPRRDEQLTHLLATARLLRQKLDRAAATAGAAQRAPGRVIPSAKGCGDARVIGDGTARATLSPTAGGTLPPAPARWQGGAWFRYSAARQGPVSFTTSGSSFDTVLSVYDLCSDQERARLLAVDDDSGGTLQSRATLRLAAGQEVWVRLTGFADATGSYELAVGPASGGISGRVTRDDTGAALAGVRIGLYAHPAYFVDETTTASDGTYVFPDLDDGVYYVRTFDAPGLIDERYDDQPCPFYNPCFPDYGTQIWILGEAVTDVDLALTPAGALQGTVTEETTGAPVAGFVELYSVTGGYLDGKAIEADGSFEIDGLPPGKYHLRTDTSEHRDELYDDHVCGRYDCVETDGDRIGVGAGATTTGVDFVLERLGSISGTLTVDGSETPIGDGSVEVFNDTLSVGAYTLSDGSYSVASLPSGNYYVQSLTGAYRDEVYDDLPCDAGCDLAGATQVPVTAGNDTSGIDFALPRYGGFSGTVRHAVTGQPLEGLAVQAYDAFGHSIFGGRAYAAADGSYRVDNLPPGTYFARTDYDIYINQLFDGLPCHPSCIESDGTPVIVSLGTTTPGIDFSIRRLGIIEGTVTGADTGEPLSVAVSVFDADGTEVEVGSAVYGSFSIAHLEPGTYRLKAVSTDPYDEYQDELFPDVPCEPNCDLTAGAGLTLDLDETITGVDFVLRPCPGDSYQSVVGTTFLSTHLLQACERVSASSDTTVAPGADVTFRAGRAIVLGSGFSVANGGRFRAQINPSWATE